MRINEVISPPLLFHGAPLLNLLNILNQNVIEASENVNHDNEPFGVRCSRYEYVANDFTTRFDNGFGGGVLVLDRTRLAHRFKIVPHDDFRDRPGWERWESEEIVVGDIKPLDRYLVRIDVPPEVFENLYKPNDHWENFSDPADDQRWYQEQAKALLNHPKFNPRTKAYIQREIPD